MKGNRLPLLAVITVIIVIAAVLASRQDAPQTSQQRTLLFPDISNNINTLGEITIQSGDKSLSMLRQAEQWVVQEADNYPAKFEKIKETAVAITDLRMLAEKTSKAELYTKLGVEDPNAEGAKSMLLTLKDHRQNQLLGLIVGNQRQVRSTGAKPAFYARLPGSGQALLVEGKLDVSLDINDWFERDLLDIPAGRIRAIHIKHGENSSFRLQRDNKDDDFVLDNIPAGRAPDSAAIGRVPSLLEGIYIDDVKAEANFSFPGTAVITSVGAFDGLVATITSAEMEGNSYIKLVFAYEEPVEQAAPAEAEEKSTTESSEITEAAVEKTDVKQEVERLNKLVSGWVYEIPGYKFELFRKKTEDLLEEPEKEETE